MLTKLKSLVVATFLLLSTGVFCYSQNVTMKMTGVTVGDAITALNQNANYSVIVNSDDVNLQKKVDVNVRNASVEEVLGQIFAGQDVAWTIDGRSIFVTKKPLPSSQKAAVQRPGLFTGKIIDVDGEPLPGASLIIKGTTTGVSTDLDGRFSMDIKKYPVTLVAGFLVSRKNFKLALPLLLFIFILSLRLLPRP